MSENTESTATAGEPTEAASTEVREFEAITSQEDFDRIIQSRVVRERAKFADYETVKARAAKLDEIESANQTEAQKAQTRIDAAEKRAAELETKALRAEVANAKGVPASLLTGGTQEELEAAADALIAFRGEQKQTPSSSALGRVNGQQVKGTTADQFADFMQTHLT